MNVGNNGEILKKIGCPMSTRAYTYLIYNKEISRKGDVVIYLGKDDNSDEKVVVRQTPIQNLEKATFSILLTNSENLYKIRTTSLENNFVPCLNYIYTKANHYLVSKHFPINNIKTSKWYSELSFLEKVERAGEILKAGVYLYKNEIFHGRISLKKLVSDGKQIFLLGSSRISSLITDMSPIKSLFEGQKKIYLKNI